MTKAKHENNIAEYDSSGTKPDTTLLADVNAVKLAVEKHKTDNFIEHNISGVLPDTALLGVVIRKDSVTEQSHGSTVIEYEPADETGERVGHYPNDTIQSNIIKRGSVISETHKIKSFGYEAPDHENTVGTEPVSVNTGDKYVIDAATGATATEYSVNYNPCGTTFTQE